MKTTNIYTITKYTQRQAKRLGVVVKPSTNRHKKIDVYTHNGTHKIASIGALGMMDYPTFLKTTNKTHANRRRIQYKRRHEKDRHKKGTPGWYADQLLW